MPRSKAAVNELGTIYARGAECCAHIQFRDDDGYNKHVYGPSRGSANEAGLGADEHGDDQERGGPARGTAGEKTRAHAGLHARKFLLHRTAVDQLGVV